MKMENELYLYNSLSGSKEKFESIHPGRIGLYVCGPTVYSDVHLGNCRTFISFDMIYRYLSFIGYQVRYVRNITDAGHLEDDADQGEDKIAKRARLESLEPMEIVQRYTVDFHKVMGQFNTHSPSIEPTATGHIIEQIEFIQSILDKGLAYENNGSIYFDVEKYNTDNNYGILSGRKIEELISNTRDLDGQDEKRNPLDFALWKGASPTHIMRWNSPWGEGFPGWHLECTVMSTRYLGEHFDIHGGGMDLKFPHHECEIAQGRASTGLSPVKYWLHTNMLTMNGKKMSKSTGNSLLPGELFSGENDILEKAYHPMVVRFFMMQAHYRSMLDFSSDALTAAEKGFNKLMTAFGDLESLVTSDKSSENVDSLIASFYAAMNDDFNTPVLIANLFEAVNWINKIKDGAATITKTDAKKLLSNMSNFIGEVLGLKSTESGDDDALEAAMSVIIEIRKNAREKEDWGTSDLIRDKLSGAGIDIRDSKDGTSWTLK